MAWDADGPGDADDHPVNVTAALMAAVAVEPEPPAMLSVGGPEAMTKNEAIALAGHPTQRRMKVQRMPRPVARVAIRILARRYDALATAFGAGLHQDTVAATWDDATTRTSNHAPPGQRFHPRASPRPGMSNADAGR